MRACRGCRKMLNTSNSRTRVGGRIIVTCLECNRVHRYLGVFPIADIKIPKDIMEQAKSKIFHHHENRKGGLSESVMHEVNDQLGPNLVRSR